MTLTRWEVSSKDLCSRFDPQQFPFETTEKLPYEEQVIGQVRAVRAMEDKKHPTLPASSPDTSDEDSAEEGNP